MSYLLFNSTNHHMDLNVLSCKSIDVMYYYVLNIYYKNNVFDYITKYYFWRKLFIYVIESIVNFLKMFENTTTDEFFLKIITLILMSILILF